MNRTGVVTYARVSTADQVDTGTSLDDQKRRLIAAAAARSALHVAHFEDAGVSGSLESRPGLDALIARVAEADIALVLATKIDRVSRSAIGLLKLVETLRSHRCDLVLIDEGLDTSTPAGDLTSGVLGVIGGWERRRIAERTNQGRLTAAQTEGRFVSSTPPYGYEVMPAPDGRGKRLVVHAKQADTVRTIFQRLISDGVSAATVAAELNDASLRPARLPMWTSRTLQRWVMRETSLRSVSGTWVFNGVEVAIPAILTPSEAAIWRDWQRRRRASAPSQQARGPYLLSGLLHMPCGRSAMGRTAGQQRPTYSCRQHYLPKTDSGRHHTCHNSAVDLLDGAVIDQVRQVLTEPSLLNTASAQYLGRSADLSHSYVALEQEIRSVQDQIQAESRSLRQGGLHGESLASALLPLQERHEQLAREVRALQRRTSAAASLQNHEHRRQLVLKARQAMDTEHVKIWRPLLELLRTVIQIEGYRACPICGGSGYLTFEPGGGRRRPANCSACLRGRNPDITIEIDDLSALVAAESIA